MGAGRTAAARERQVVSGTRSETVLIVDDDPEIRETLARALDGMGYEVLAEPTGDGGVAAYRRERPDVVVLDIGLPDRSGLDVLEDLRQDGAVVVLLTGRADVPTAVSAMQRGAENFLTKPVELPHLAVAVARACEKARLRREVRRLRGRAYKESTLTGTLGVSPAMQAKERELETIAGSPRTTVLLTGESGTGKGRVAQRIHAASPRADGPFVEINCAGLTAPFLADELFGHERGAFTDARDRKLGLLEVAHGGTAFLDEIGDLTVELQPKLLTVLESRRFRRLGGTREIAADVRLIVATNHDLQLAVEQGRFREDLYYRIAVSIVELPPVRDRTREDRLHLVRQVLAELSTEIPDAPTDLDSNALERLLAYPWPGNVREMRNVLERGMIMARTASAIGLQHLPGELRRRATRLPGHRFRSLQETTRQHIGRVLRGHGGNRTRAAADLGISRVTLIKKIRELELD